MKITIVKNHQQSKLRVSGTNTWNAGYDDAQILDIKIKAETAEDCGTIGLSQTLLSSTRQAF
ncbi:hypothetical protein NAC44_01795 [Allorhizobium sp. BGMRC 0089]|uniref:hypothetical protein n=1 Tax=Allorhizobium sonneratiae TaxID=2934936 RepID=UPI002033292A|nr:hypothetical protein [Allorhizobium sonneratiae]MCM2291060.1 hypothetical protein [Allorhizobium sonneratiae]